MINPAPMKSTPIASTLFLATAALSADILGTSSKAIAQTGFEQSAPQVSYQYVGADNAETRIHFRARLELAADSEPTDKKVAQAIEAQIHLLPGPMEFRTWLMLSPRKTHEVSAIAVHPSQAKP